MTEKLKDTTDSSIKLSRWSPFWVAIIGLLLYANTIGNDYALDDGAVIGANTYVQQGIKGIPALFTTDTWHFENTELGYYRPLSLVTFAIEHQLFNNSAAVSHLINVLLYAISAFFLSLLLFRIFSNYNPLFPFVIALLFIAHPLHTEIVANIKSRDELLSFLNLVLATWLLLRAADSQRVNWKFWLLSCFFFYLALLSKETAMMGLVLIPLLLYFTKPISANGAIKYGLPLLALVVIFQLQKYIALGSLAAPDTSDIVSFPYTGTSARLATAFLHLAWYFKLAVIPYPLSYNYAYNQIPVADWTSIGTVLGMFIAIALAFFSFNGLSKKSPLTLGTLIFSIALIPAIAFVIIKGGILAERFLYAPSFGFCIVLTWLIFKGLKIPLSGDINATNNIGVKASPFLVVFLLFSAETVSRNMDWKNDLTLSGHDVNVAPNSCQVHLHYGKKLIDEGVAENDPAKKQLAFKLGTEQLYQVININPHYARAYFKMAYAYQSLEENNDSAIYYYTRSIDEAPGYSLADNNLGALYLKLGKFQLATHYLQKALEINPDLANATQLMKRIKQMQSNTEIPAAANSTVAENGDTTFEAYSNMGVKCAQEKNFADAQKYLIKAIHLKPNSAEARVNLAVCYGMMNEYDRSLQVLNDALKIDPNNKSALKNAAALYRITGNKAKEKEFRDKLLKAEKGPS